VHIGRFTGAVRCWKSSISTAGPPFSFDGLTMGVRWCTCQDPKPSWCEEVVSGPSRHDLTQGFRHCRVIVALQVHQGEGHRSMGDQIIYVLESSGKRYVVSKESPS
jgi:uncharacterized protein (DUF2237 family)